jgi:mannose-6-phosphate isomerase-like protein (cupin superfamily)
MPPRTAAGFRPVVVRAGQAEYLPTIGHLLLADSSATHGLLSAHRVKLGRGADGAVPHRHQDSAELFFVIDGSLQVLMDGAVTCLSGGDLAVVPPGMIHAFAAQHDSPADALILAAPGIERFDYFRRVADVRAGHEPRESLLALQDRFDTHFAGSTAWDLARARRPVTGGSDDD